MTETIYLVDEAGNFIVDEGGNFIVLIEIRDPLELHAQPTDTLFHAHRPAGTYTTYIATAYTTYTLVDESGNFIVDEGGNNIVAIDSIDTTTAAVMLIAPKTDTLMHAEAIQ